MTKRINSKNKGNKAERGVAQALSEWADIKFIRTPSSGGAFHLSGLKVFGDIIPADPQDMVRFPFTVEVKSYKGIDFEAPLLGQNTNWKDWWNQVDQDAERSGKLPIVFMRRNLMPKGEHYCILSWDVFDTLDELKAFRHPRGYYNYWNELVIFPSRDLLRTPYPEIETVLNNIQWNEL